MYFRNARRKSTVKRKLEVDNPGVSEKNVPKTKKGGDNTSLERNLALLKKSKEEDFSKETYKKLLNDTFNHRREFIEHKATSTKEILKEYPFLCNPQHVSKSVFLLRCVISCVHTHTHMKGL